MKLADYNSNPHAPKTMSSEDVIFSLNYWIIYIRLHETAGLSQTIKNKKSTISQILAEIAPEMGSRRLKWWAGSYLEGNQWKK